MLHLLLEIFGSGKNLSWYQICDRGILIFVIALILIRVSGRRSFGVRSPFDNIIIILLGAILSRAVIGASPILSTIAVCTLIVLLHRFTGYIVAHNKFWSSLIEGNKIILFENGRFIKENMDKGLVCEEDIMQGVRKSALTESMDNIKSVFIERNGEISAIKKENKE
jgi:uncharacterized membrane protein YcaP (DUF421 family)